MKKYLLFLFGIVTGVAGCIVGFYFSTQEPKELQPNTPSNLAILLKFAVDNNNLSGVRALMMPKQQAHFTSSDLNSLRQYVKAGSLGEGSSSIDTYLVITFTNHQTITVYLVPPDKQNHLWRIQSISEGIHVK